MKLCNFLWLFLPIFLQKMACLAIIKTVMKRAITTILSYITMTAVLLLGFGDILLLPENTGELPRISHFVSAPIAFADGGFGTGDGGPNWTGQ